MLSILDAVVTPDRRATSPLEPTWPVAAPLCAADGQTEAAVVWIRYRCSSAGPPGRIVVRQGELSGELAAADGKPGEHVAMLRLPDGLSANAASIYVASGDGSRVVPVELISPARVVSLWATTLAIKLGATGRTPIDEGVALRVADGLACLSLTADTPRARLEALRRPATQPPDHTVVRESVEAGAPAQASAARGDVAALQPNEEGSPMDEAEREPLEGPALAIELHRLEAEVLPWWARAVGWVARRLVPPDANRVRARRELLEQEVKEVDLGLKASQALQRRLNDEYFAAKAAERENLARRYFGWTGASPLHPEVLTLHPTIQLRDAVDRPRWPSTVVFSDEHRTRPGVGGEVALPATTLQIRAWSPSPVTVRPLLTLGLVGAVSRLYQGFPHSFVEISARGLWAQQIGALPDPEAMGVWFAAAFEIMRELDRVAPRAAPVS